MASFRGARLGGLVPSLLLALAAGARAADCPGPAECCAATPAETLDHPAKVAVGVVIVGLYNVNERSSTWDADYYLYEAWQPQPGFAPQTEVVNEVARLSEQFGTLARRGDRCIRSRRLRSTLHSQLNLRLFPFDRQQLTLRLSDSWFYADMASYDDKPFVHGVDDEVFRQLSQWDVSQDLRYTRASHPFKWEAGVWEDVAPIYDNATFTLPVRRHTTFHLTKFFLPLLVIVLVSMTVFWVDPEDLPSQVGIGVTCLLAAIAFQLAQAGLMPEVAYLTFADLCYVVSYLAIALCLVESLYANRLARSGQRERALRADRISRVTFPVALVLLVGGAVLLTRGHAG